MALLLSVQKPVTSPFADRPCCMLKGLKALQSIVGVQVVNSSLISIKNLRPLRELRDFVKSRWTSIDQSLRRYANNAGRSSAVTNPRSITIPSDDRSGGSLGGEMRSQIFCQRTL